MIASNSIHITTYLGTYLRVLCVSSSQNIVSLGLVYLSSYLANHSEFVRHRESRPRSHELSPLIADLPLSGDDGNKAILGLTAKPVEADPVASRSLLLGLPLEILANIVDLMANDHATLAALALVNSDCRELARSCQFAEVCFKYEADKDDPLGRSGQLLRRLLEETRIRRGSSDIPSDTTRPFFVGPYICRVTVHQRMEWLSLDDRRYNPNYVLAHPTAAAHSLRGGYQPDADAASKYITTFRAPLLTVLKEAMPNLESLSWMRGACLDIPFSLGTITHLPIRRLEISAAAKIGEPTTLEAPAAPVAPSLEYLSFGAYICRECVRVDRERADDAHGRAPTAISLLIKCFGGTGTISFGQERILFPRLRHLSLFCMKADMDATAWSSLFSAPLRHLVLPFFQGTTPAPAYRQALSACQTFRDLKTLEVPYFFNRDSREDIPDILGFISRHPHLETLSAGYGTALDMDSLLLPCLSDGRWSNLTSLSLGWQQLQIDKKRQSRTILTLATTSIAAIGKIKSLEKLHLSVGNSFGSRHQWWIDHNALRSNLKGLGRLKRLAFSRDTYFALGGMPFSRVEDYYRYPIMPPGEGGDVASMGGPVFRVKWQRGQRLHRTRMIPGGGKHVAHSYRILPGGDVASMGSTSSGVNWERLHRRRMIGEADKYVALFPGLVWIFCGQWSMGVRKEQTSSGIVRSAVPLGEMRDSQRALLCRMFSMTEVADL
ncbi:hypothetical protein F5144DRAFT_540090 [Chaetomium tenue]|uniref:Uncharacterized protein n=1 Tax=Chaetomium tenue TaxID=1854479 RepID=A0ACB7P2A0_9PEZI|nr:hypothetical protein F5144DRAFT_540090 [Chaetomium globosum]